MNLLTKREILKYKIINDDNFELEIYRLININILDKYIRRIDDISLMYKASSNKDFINCNKFLIKLNNYILYIKKHFKNLENIDYIISMIFTNNKYLDKYLEEDNNDDLLIKKSIIKNFINNIKFLRIIKELEIKNVSIDTMDDKDIEKIFNILKEIIFCNRNQGNISYLFINITDNIPIKGEKINLYLKYYKSLLKNYNNKKQFIKYFM